MGDDAWQDKVMQANAGFDLDYLFQDGKQPDWQGNARLRQGKARQGRWQRFMGEEIVRLRWSVGERRG